MLQHWRGPPEGGADGCGKVPIAKVGASSQRWLHVRPQIGLGPWELVSLILPLPLTSLLSHMLHTLLCTKPSSRHTQYTLPHTNSWNLYTQTHATQSCTNSPSHLFFPRTPPPPAHSSEIQKSQAGWVLGLSCAWAPDPHGSGNQKAGKNTLLGICGGECANPCRISTNTAKKWCGWRTRAIYFSTLFFLALKASCWACQWIELSCCIQCNMILGLYFLPVHFPWLPA